MKRLLTIMLAGLMTFSLAGCGAASDKSNGNAGTAADGAAAKKYIIATDTTFAPFEFENESGKLVGIDMDILAAIAEDQGFEYEIKSLGFSAAVTALEANQCDGVIAGMSITDKRIALYDFSEPYFESGVGMGIKEDSNITSYED